MKRGVMNVRLSISSSRSGQPNEIWSRVWLLACALALTVVLCWEIVFKYYNVGMELTVDSPDLWAKNRKEASLLGGNAVLLVGASRIQLGVNLQTLHKNTRKTPIQLAIDGSYFMPILDNLSKDDSIKGTILVSVIETSINPNGVGGKANDWLAYYENKEALKTPIFYRDIEERLENKVNSLLNSRMIGAKPYRYLYELYTGKPTLQVYIKTLPDRSRLADYDLIDAKLLHTRRLQRHYETAHSTPPMTIPEFKKNISILEKMIQRIQKRGGKVILIRFPTGPSIWEIDQSIYPKNQYWRLLEEMTSARTIHFMDYPELQQFIFPDGSHLDYRETERFTNVLSNIIFQQD